MIAQRRDELKHVQDLFLEKINALCKKFGLNNIMSQLYAILYFSGKPLSLNDMVAELQISKGSVSVNIRALEAYGVVRRVLVRGSRKDYYEAEADIAKVLVERASSMAEKRLSEFGRMIDSSYEALNSMDPENKSESVIVFRQRLDKLKSFYEQAASMFGLMNSMVKDTVLAQKVPEKKDES